MTRQPTILDVAALAGVSKSVVSRVMNDSPLVSAETRKAVLKAAAQIGYRPNAAARHLASNRTRILGAVVDDLHNPFFADMLDGVEDVARERGYRVMVMAGKRNTRREEDAVEAFLELRVDGILLAGPQIRPQTLKRASSATRVVVAAHRLRGNSVRLVATDDIRGAELAVEHLAGLGHSQIAYLQGAPSPPARDRLSGYRRSMRKAGLAPVVLQADFTEEGGYAAARELVRSGNVPTAICAPNDIAAIGVINALEDEGMSVPGDVSVIGYDDTVLAGLRHISLTTVHQPRRALGTQAAELLLAEEEGTSQPKQILLPPHLVVRSSTAAAKGGQEPSPHLLPSPTFTRSTP
ncbi:MAG: LacI family DNA-binding transcriptional regulator [Actinomycetota bacterium]|nr:LacI family DNA-binding transcriptional regulator [Actinomycetota bacterium]